MDSPEFQRAYDAQNREDQIYYSTLATALSIILNLSCSIMDYRLYPYWAPRFLMARLACVLLLALIWLWFRSAWGNQHHRIFGVAWYALPLIMILWMIYKANDLYLPYYAGLNIVLLAVGLLSPWTFRQNLISAALVVICYLAVDLSAATPPAGLGSSADGHHQPEPRDITANNTTFLILTAVIVVCGSLANSRQRYREFVLRWELDQSQKATSASLQQLKENEIQLVQSEKMASLGRVSAGIMHEINNPLNIATTGLYTLRNQLNLLPADLRPAYTEVVADVEESVERVRTIVADMRTFSHPVHIQRDEVKIAPAVALALRFLSHEWLARVQIETQIPENQTVFVNQNNLVHVLMNLLQNAFDALKSKVGDAQGPTVWITGWVEGNRSLLSIRDNGTGIDAPHLDKIFEPFYTTKEVGEGMGLGLSICHRILRENGAKISVKTEPGRFCEFVLEFLRKE